MPTVTPPSPGAWITTILNNFLRIVVWPVFIGVSVIMIIWAGFLYVTAAGDPSKIQTAKKALIFAVIGIVVGILAFSAVTIITNIIAPPSGTNSGLTCYDGSGNVIPCP